MRKVNKSAIHCCYSVKIHFVQNKKKVIVSTDHVTRVGLNTMKKYVFRPDGLQGDPGISQNWKTLVDEREKIPQTRTERVPVTKRIYKL